MNEYPTRSDDSFDYIIIGAGSAGCLLANRLSVDPGVRVALLEAGGPDDNMWIQIPAGTRSVVGNPETDWCFETEVEPVLGRKGQVARGKVLGGSSSINGTVYTRGLESDYDLWRQLGLSGWGWDDVEPYFRRLERFSDGGDAARGGGGELCIEKPRLKLPIFDILNEAAAQAGFPLHHGFKTGNSDAFGMYDVTQKRGRRWSSAKAFLEPVRHRKNLSVFVEAICLGIDFVGSRACGLRMRLNSVERRISARREVILCAGAIGSPQLLQTSGIGSGNMLRDAGVKVILDNPAVGANLQDHLSVRLAWEIQGADTVNTMYHHPLKRVAMALEYAAFGSGPLVMGAPLWGGYLRSDETREHPNLQVFVMPLSVSTSGATSFSTPDKFDGVSCGVYNVRPRSRGRVWITSPDVSVRPRILHNYLADEDDRRVAVRSLKLMRRLFSQKAFAALKPKEFRPGRNRESEDDLFNAVIETSGTAFHQVGTCAMGTGATGVVDECLRVKGVEGLRVVDGSIMPNLVSGNTNGPIMMIAEKAATLIRSCK